MDQTPLIWHQCLGHPSSSTLPLFKHVIPILSSIYKFPLCIICNVVKSHHIPFQKSTSCTSHLLQLIHTNVWGLYPIASSLGFKYYVLFIVDHSHFTWVYPMRCKYEVSNIFTTFKTLVENQLNCKIKKIYKLMGVGSIVTITSPLHYRCQNKSPNILPIHS